MSNCTQQFDIGYVLTADELIMHDVMRTCRHPPTRSSCFLQTRVLHRRKYTLLSMSLGDAPTSNPLDLRAAPEMEMRHPRKRDMILIAPGVIVVHRKCFGIYEHTFRSLVYQ